MSEHAETSGAPTTPPIARSAAAERMRTPSTTQRGLRCLTIVLRVTDIDALIRRGLLEADARNDRLAI